jgi:GT2 family glycosyltransferase
MAATAPLAARTVAARDISVVIVNWNGGTDLAECVAALRGDMDGRVDEIVVVDNDSTDDSLDRLGSPPRVTIVRAGRNLGFAAGVNLGARRCTGRLLLLLNPDVRVLPGAIATTADYLDGHPDVGIAGPLLVDGRGRWQPSAGRLGALGHVVLDTRFARRPILRTRSVGWIHGAFLLMPRALFDAVGGLDEAYFMYGEDLDLCSRVRTAGYRTIVVAEARAVHYGNRSGAVRWGDARDTEVVKGEMRFYAWAGRPWELALFRIVAGLKFATKGALQALGGDYAAARRTWRMAGACASFVPEARVRQPPGRREAAEHREMPAR